MEELNAIDQFVSVVEQFGLSVGLIVFFGFQFCKFYLKKMQLSEDINSERARQDLVFDKTIKETMIKQILEFQPKSLELATHQIDLMEKCNENIQHVEELCQRIEKTLKDKN